MKNLIVVVAVIAAGYLAYQNIFNALPDENMIFTLNNCALCEDAKNLMDEYEIEYTEYNIRESPEYRAEYQALGGVGVPFVMIGDIPIAGYSLKAYRAALKQLDLM